MGLTVDRARTPSAGIRTAPSGDEGNRPVPVTLPPGPQIGLEVRAELLSDSPVWDLVRRESIEDLLKERNLPNSESKFLFSLLGTKMFLEHCSA